MLEGRQLAMRIFEDYAVSGGGIVRGGCPPPPPLNVWGSFGGP